MEMELITDKKALIALVEDASKGQIALPQFQRNFVWGREDIADLLRSLFRGYFIGSFLLLRVHPDHAPFCFRALQGVELHPDQLRPEWLILDGQQRLTSLFYALHGPAIPVKNTSYPYRFFLNLDSLVNDEDERLIESVRADQIGLLSDRNTQFQQRILPLTQVSQWHAWKDAYTDWLEDTRQSEEREHYRKVLRPLWRVAVEENLLGSNIPFIELPKIDENREDSIAEVCVIFEKLNSTGVRLGVYDLLTARLYRFNIDMHSLWQEAMEDHARLADFSGGKPDQYGVFVLRTIGLLRRLEVRTKTLINLRPENFEDDWRRAVRSLEKALQRLTSTQEGGFGVFDQKWQPYTTLLPVLAVALDWLEREDGDAGAYEDLQAWYWGSVFGERYTGSVETVTYRDSIDLLRRFTDPTFVPTAFREIQQRILQNQSFSFLYRDRTSSPYKGIMNLVALRGARDFSNGDTVEFHELEDHHIFPKAHLREDQSISASKELNTIVNRTLITARTNRAISRKRPSQYVVDLMPKDRCRQILSSHFIGEAAQQAMLDDDYDAFRVSRDEILVREVRHRVARAEI